MYSSETDLRTTKEEDGLTPTLWEGTRWGCGPVHTNLPSTPRREVNREDGYLRSLNSGP